MPDFPIVDAHLHLRDPDRSRMSWLDGNPRLDQRYDLAEYRDPSAGVGIEARVYLQVEVEPLYALLEAQWAAEWAMVDPRIRRIVPWAPLEYDERARALELPMVLSSSEHLVKVSTQLPDLEPATDHLSRRAW